MAIKLLDTLIEILEKKCCLTKFYKMEKEKIRVKTRNLNRGRSFLLRNQVPITSLVVNGREFPINSTKGEKTISKATDLFTVWIDEKFETSGFNKPGKPTQKILAKIHKINREESLVKTFSSISLDFNKLVLEQEQIIDFCADYPYLFLQEDVGTLFITKADGWFYAVLVVTRKNGLEVMLYNARSNKKAIYEWIHFENLRIITPDLTII